MYNYSLKIRNELTTIQQRLNQIHLEQETVSQQLIKLMAKYGAFWRGPAGILIPWDVDEVPAMETGFLNYYEPYSFWNSDKGKLDVDYELRLRSTLPNMKVIYRGPNMEPQIWRGGGLPTHRFTLEQYRERYARYSPENREWYWWKTAKMI